MRPLTDDETKTMFEKLSKYIGENIKHLVDRPDGTYCFRLHNDRVYYISETILKLATNISRGKLVSVGTCFGKFTKTIKFRLHITALDFLAPYAKFKVWVKPGQEQSFLYGNHVLKSGLGRITENTNQYQGVVVYSMADVPLVSWPSPFTYCPLSNQISQHIALPLHILSIIQSNQSTYSPPPSHTVHYPIKSVNI
uniref:NIP7 nucleolar pre-rRNA processing protein n=1 Tax=Oncorhynchus mykiss TaxID=8022 RepID=A0A8K9XZ05_ONCMY